MEQGHRDRAGELAGEDVSAHAADPDRQERAPSELSDSEPNEAGSKGAEPKGAPIAPALANEAEKPAKLSAAAIRGALRKAWTRLRGGDLTPWRAAASVAVGLAIGVTPLYGLHLWIVLAVCLPLKLDAPVAYLAANISLPFVSPFLLLTEAEIGAWARTGHGTTLSLEAFRNDRSGVLTRLFVEVVVGTAIFAPLIAVVGGAATYVFVRRARKGKSPLAAAIERVATRFASGRRGTFYYVRSKLASDPVATAIASLDGLGEVVDAGSGRGQLALLLLEANRASSVYGFDWDAAKIADARAAAGDLAATFETGDLRTHAMPACDTVLLVDVLHYLDDAAQDAVLTRAARAARNRVIVRELDPDRGWRSAVTRFQERLTTSARYNRGERVRARPIDAITRVLSANGLTVEIAPCWGKTPFSNVLVVAQRERGSEKMQHEGAKARRREKEID